MRSEAGDATEGGRPAVAASLVCLSSQEWDAPLPTNRQQIMTRAARRGHAVLFVETGDFLGKHFVRLLLGPGRRRLLGRLLGSREAAPGLAVTKVPNVLPWGQRYRLSAAANGRVAAAVIGWRARRLPAPRVAWLYDPRATWAIGRVGDAFAVYDCVDDYAEQATGERNRALVAAADRAAAARARLVFVTTEALRRRHLAANPRTVLVPNVGDFAHFAPAAAAERARLDLARLERPVLGFVGNLLVRKVDLRLLEELAAALRGRGGGTVLVAGPAPDGLRPELERLAGAGAIRWLGPVAYEEAPAVVAAFDVALIPYSVNEYTRNVSPLKLHEYLAAGKPVVAAGLPVLRGLEPDVVVADDAEEFVAAAFAALDRQSPDDVARRQALAARNTWDTRAAALLDAVAEELRRAGVT